MFEEDKQKEQPPIAEIAKSDADPKVTKIQDSIRTATSNPDPKKKPDPVTEALERGEIPEELMESWRIVDPESQEGKVFQEICLKIAKELYDPNPPPNKRTATILGHHNFDKEPVRFILTKDPLANAGYLRKSNPPIFMFSEGLFTNRKFRLEDDTPITEAIISSPDEFKMIIGHEITHAKLEGVFSDHPNSKLEESAADLVPLKLLADSGQNPESALWLHKKLELAGKTINPSNPNTTHWREIFDVHPVFRTRYSMLENGLTALRKERGDLGGLTKAEKFPPSHPLHTCVKDSKHTSHIDTLLPENYETMEPLAQLELLYEIFTKISPTYEIRYNDLNQKINKLTKRISPSDAKSTIDKFADFIIEKTPQEGFHKFRRIYGSISRLENPKAFRMKALGKLRKIADTTADFVRKVESKADEKEIKEAAKIFIESLDSEPLFEERNGKELIQAIDWPTFALPKVASHSSAVPIGWQKLRELAQKDNNCLQAALALGLGEDPVIFTEACGNLDLALSTFATYQNSNTELSKKGFRTLSKNLKNDEGYSLQEFYIDGNGRAILVGHIPEGQGPEKAKQKVKRDEYKRQSLDTIFMHYLHIVKTTQDEREKAHAMNQIETVKQIYATFTMSPEPIAPELADEDLETFLEINKGGILRERGIANIIYTKCNMLAEKGENKKIIKRFFGLNEDKTLETIDIIGRALDESRVSREEGKDEILIDEDVHLYYVLRNRKQIFSNQEVLQLCEKNINEYLSDSYTSKKGRAYRWAKEFLLIINPIYTKENIPTINANPTWNEIDEFLQKNTKTSPFPNITKAIAACHAMILIETVEPTLTQIIKLLKNLKAFPPDLINRFRKIINVNFTKIANSKPATATKNWKILQEKDLLDTAEAEKSLEKLISIIERDPVAERIKSTQTLIEGPRIIDGPLREKLIKMLISDIAVTCGQDDGSEKYHDKIKPYIEWIIKKVSRTDQSSILDRLGKSLVSQHHLTYNLEASLPDIKKEDLNTAGFGGVLGETTIEIIRDNQRFQQALLEFIIHPHSEKSNNKLVKFIREEIGENKFFVQSIQNLGNRISIKEMKEQLKDLHENFWLAPFEVRVFILKEMLSSKNSLEAALEQTMDLMFDKDDKYKDETARFIKGYIYSLPEYTRFVALAAMIGASEKRLESKGTLGESIAMFAERMGPAETKVAQVAEGHPNVPEDISSGLRRLKFSADEPPRWEIMHCLDDIAEELLTSYKQNPACKDKSSNLKISSVGRVLGSASIFIAVEIFLSDGSNHVVALKRPYALERGRSGFETLNTCLEDLGEEHSAVSTMHELVNSAAKRLEYETSCELAPLQYSTAKEIYSDRKIKVKDSDFTFDTPPVTASGKSFFMMGKVSGKHFSAMPTSSAEEQEHKKRCAQAIVTQELINMFNGAFDSDRHGGNLLIEGNTIHHIDFKGLMLEKPSPTGYEQLARLLMEVMPSIITGKEDILTSFIKAQKKIQEKEKTLDPYVSEVTKGIISLGEYLKELSPGDLSEVFQKVMAETQTSPLAKALRNVRSQ